jgi:hypothetical protein
MGATMTKPKDGDISVAHLRECFDLVLLLVGISLCSLATVAAQEPQYSCTESRNACYDQTMHDPNGLSECEPMHRMCMKTGRWVNSRTKMDYGPRRKL